MPKVSFTNRMIDDYLEMNQHVQAIRSKKDVSAQTRAKMFRIFMQLTESVEGKSFAAQKQEIYEEIIVYKVNPETNQPIKNRGTVNTGDPKLLEFYRQDSGIVIEKIVLAIEEFDGMCDKDHTGSAWIYEWVPTLKDVKKAEEAHEDTETDQSDPNGAEEEKGG